MNALRYDYKSITLTNGASDYDVASENADLFSAVKVAKSVIIDSDKPISVKFNNPLNPAISVTARRLPLQTPKDFLDVTNIFLSNASGADATVTIWLI